MGSEAAAQGNLAGRGEVGAMLIVDDDGLAARAIHRVVSRHAPTVVTHRMSAALDAVRRREPTSWAAAIVDIGLPDGSGIELTRVLRMLVPGLPVLVITGADTRESANDALEAGAQFAYKPMPMRALDAFVEQAIEGRPDSRVEAAVRALARQRALSDRETHLVRLASRGATRGELAERLAVSENTVKTHVRSVLLKCDAESLDAVVRHVLHGALVHA